MLDRLRSRALREDEGFTLIELLIVIVILGILAAIVVFAVGNSTSQAKTSACNADVKTVETALEAYKANNGGYPASGDYTTLNAGTGGPFLKDIPPGTDGITWTTAGVVSGTC